MQLRIFLKWPMAQLHYLCFQVYQLITQRSFCKQSSGCLQNPINLFASFYTKATNNDTYTGFQPEFQVFHHLEQIE